MSTREPTVPIPATVGAEDRGGRLARVWNAVVAVWGAVSGLLPHVLHHVGPVAGTALVAGAGGKAVFGALGLVASVPFLLRLHRRFHTWLAPGIAMVLFVATFSLSTFVIGPWISGTRTTSAPAPTPSTATTESPGHDQHGH